MQILNTFLLLRNLYQITNLMCRVQEVDGDRKRRHMQTLCDTRRKYPGDADPQNVHSKTRT